MLAVYASQTKIFAVTWPDIMECGRVSNGKSDVLTRVYTLFATWLDDSNFPFLGVAFEMSVAMVPPGKPATKFKTIFAPLDVAEECSRPFNHIAVFRAVVPHEVLTILERRFAAVGCALEGSFMASVVATWLVKVELRRFQLTWVHVASGKWYRRYSEDCSREQINKTR
jgi:hypothetical protein